MGVGVDIGYDVGVSVDVGQGVDVSVDVVGYGVGGVWVWV